ncbi:MAG: hypothetical protein HKN04_08320 [Rhodothermaceae bacterium]|nr:hypothetical protein [Rhodothermaceae bacterium]
MAHQLDNVDTERDFRLGAWLVKPSSNEIVQEQESRRLEHKVMRLLVFFAQQAGRDLSRDEILRGVWGEGVHNEEVLTVAVSSLRKALKDDPKSPRFIKTVPRYGYHMLQTAEATAEKASSQGLWGLLEQRVGLRFLIIAALLGFLLLVVLVQVVVELVYMLGR